jgi:hypothetical protein
VLKWLGKRSSHHSNPLFREAVFIRCKIYRPQEVFLREHSCFPMPRSCVFIRRPQDFCLWDRFFRLRSCQVMTGMAKWQNLLSWPIDWHNAWWCVEFKMVTLRGNVSFTHLFHLCAWKWSWKTQIFRYSNQISINLKEKWTNFLIIFSQQLIAMLMLKSDWVRKVPEAFHSRLLRDICVSALILVTRVAQICCVVVLIFEWLKW